MNTHTTEQLLMCEKSDLVKYIEELKEANDTFTLGAKRTIQSNCKLYKENQELKEQVSSLQMFRERSQEKSNVITKLNKEIKSLKSFRNHYKNSYEDEKRKNDGLKIDHSMNTQYWNCYLSYADPKADMLPEKEHIDNWCKIGDVVDEKLKEYLYDQFCIDEDEEE